MTLLNLPHRVQTAALASLVALAGCTTSAPPVTLPTAGVSAESRFSDISATRSSAPFVSHGWWRSFGSDELDQIIARLLRDNPDLAAASLRVLQSELNAANVRSRSPNAVGGASFGSTSVSDGSGGRTATATLELSTSISWEADLWGRIAREGDAAASQLLATSLDREALANSLIATVLRQYITLSFNRRDMEATRRVVDIRISSLTITQERFERGVESTDAGSVNSARENLAAAQADLPRLELEAIEVTNAIDVLTGRVPTSRNSIAGRLPQHLPALHVTTGTPLQLLDHRPDIRAAAARLQAANANIAVSVADRFPALSGALSLRSSASDLDSLLDIDNIIASLVADLMMTVFDGGRGSRIVAIRQAEAEELARAYVATVLVAVQEVEDALSAERLLAQQAAQLRDRLAAARQATQIASDRYRDGTGAYLTLLDASRSEANAESAFLAVERSRWLNRVDLMLALGGRWSAAEQE